MILVTILLVINWHFILYLKDIILKMPGNKFNKKGYNILVKKLIKVSLRNGMCVWEYTAQKADK